MTKLLKPIEPGKYISPEEALREIEKMPDAPEIPEAPKPKQPETSLEKKVLLEAFPADKGNKKSQNSWILYWNIVRDGRTFASMPDLYYAFKQLKDYAELGTDAEKRVAEKFVASLREDMESNSSKNNFPMSSTRIIYSGRDIHSTIIHYYNLDKIDHTICQIDAPVSAGKKIPDFSFADRDGYDYLKALFNTRDGLEIIVQTLEFISGKKRNDIEICTPTLSVREKEPEMAAGFVYTAGRFHVLCNEAIGAIGRSRGVAIKNPK